jgi:hypothetical protein
MTQEKMDYSSAMPRFMMILRVNWQASMRRFILYYKRINEI